MNDLVQDTWHDLREKRLWPVAAVLVLAIVAVPVLLSKSAAEPPAVAPVVQTEPDERIAVELDESGSGSSAGSALDRFSEGDPFTPPAAIVKAGADTTATASAAGPTGGGDDPGGGGGEPGGAPGSTPAPPADVDPPQTRTETTQFEYVADATFWNGERRRAIRGLHKLDMLPSQRAPVLIFMGTADNGGNAVFLVDSTLKPAGEGRCVPGPENCVYVHVGPGSEHAFTTEDGDSYRLRIDEIRRVEVKPRSSGARRPSARGSSGAAGARRFQLPSLIDLVAVTEETVQEAAASPANRSSAAKGGR
jgi:hypothetical protein